VRKILQFILLKPVTWMANKFSSSPDKERIFAALTLLLQNIKANPGKRGITIPFEYTTGKFIIFSDQHKGAKNGADDFAGAEKNYLEALDFYCNNNFTFISLGDAEELWENSLGKVKKFNTSSFDKEKGFIAGNAFVKIFGNHDLYWDNDPFAGFELKKIYGEKIKVLEGAVLETSVNNKPLTIYCTHGHQGDEQSDGNWFSKFFVARIWAPLQAYLKINPNTPAYDANKKTKHNRIMYEWSSKQQNLLLVTGHTHQPVFKSQTHLEKLYTQLLQARKNNDAVLMPVIEKELEKRKQPYVSVPVDYLDMKPTYFNSGCCCFNDGDITGIEIENGMMRLIKWTSINNQSKYVVLEEASLKELSDQL
jgi:predicted phosphodiesterase